MTKTTILTACANLAVIVTAPAFAFLTFVIEIQFGTINHGGLMIFVISSIFALSLIYISYLALKRGRKSLLFSCITSFVLFILVLEGLTSAAMSI